MRGILSSFAVIALFSSPAVAAGDYANFEDLDVDDDGVISQQEAAGSKLEQAFQQIDIDSDQNVSEIEYQTYKQEQEIRAEAPGSQQQGSAGQQSGSNQQGGGPQGGSQQGGSQQASGGGSGTSG